MNVISEDRDDHSYINDLLYSTCMPYHPCFNDATNINEKWGCWNAHYARHIVLIEHK